MVDWFRSLLTNTRTMRNEVTASPRVITMRGLNPSILLDDDVLSRVVVPTLWLWGRDDPFGGEAIAKAMAPRLPNATLEMVDDGHAVWIDDVDGIAARVRSFLD